MDTDCVFTYECGALYDIGQALYVATKDFGGCPRLLSATVDYATVNGHTIIICNALQARGVLNEERIRHSYSLLAELNQRHEKQSSRRLHYLFLRKLQEGVRHDSWTAGLRYGLSVFSTDDVRAGLAWIGIDRWSCTPEQSAYCAHLHEIDPETFPLELCPPRVSLNAKHRHVPESCR